MRLKWKRERQNQSFILKHFKLTQHDNWYYSQDKVQITRRGWGRVGWGGVGGILGESVVGRITLQSDSTPWNHTAGSGSRWPCPHEALGTNSTQGSSSERQVLSCRHKTALRRHFRKSNPITYINLIFSFFLKSSEYRLATGILTLHTSSICYLL